jgi:periplasmic protein TonB
MPLRCVVFSSNEEMVKPIWPVLADLGIEGEYCASAVDAVEKVTTHLYQIVITDWEDQPEAAFLLKTAREQKAAQRPLTLAIVNDDASLPEALQAGANSVLLKPIRPEQVRDTMSTACELLRAKLSSASPKAPASMSAVPAKAAMAAAATAAGLAPTKPSLSPPVVSRPVENALRTGEFLSSSSSAPGAHFDTECEVQKSLDQASATEVDALTELAPMASSVAAEPAPEPAVAPSALSGWASLQERLTRVAPQRSRESSTNNELLAYGETPSYGSTTPTKVEDPVSEIPPVKTARAQAEADREAALFAYMEGEATAEPKPQEPSPPERSKAVAFAIFVAACVVLAAIPQTRQALQRGFSRSAGAGKSWLNPTPTTVPQAPTQHESFGPESDEFKVPGGNVPEATTDPSEVHVLPVVEPTAKPPKGSDANASAGVAGEPASDQGQSTPVSVVPAPAAGGSTTAPGSAISGNSTTDSAAPSPNTSPGSQPQPAPPAQQSRQPTTANSPPQTPAHPATGSSSAIPSSLRSQIASMTPEASGAKPVEAAMSSIEPVNLPEAAIWGLLAQSIDPIYPDAAKAGGQHGTVILQVLIGRDGTVQEAKFLQGSLVFARAAIDAVKQWRFKPYLLNGRPVSVQSAITLTFKAPV